MTDIRFEQATRIYRGSQSPAVDALDLHIEEGELMVLVGPSGSGKSTALRMIAGLEEVDSGGIWIGGRDVTWERPKDRDVAMVFQNYALYPFMNVEENIAFPLKLAKVPKAERRERAQAVAEMLELTEYLERRPGQLSGGQRQRVAMGRAVVREPSAFLMDEPLSNLDALLRVQMRAEIAALQRRLGVTTVYVTHDQVEAMTMGTRVAVLRGGKLQQCATPAELYAQPGNVFVAGFIGARPMNLVTAPMQDGAVTIGGAKFSPPAAIRAQAGAAASLTVGMRPEHVTLTGGSGIAARVESVEHLGAESYVACAVAVDGGEAAIFARSETQAVPGEGERVTLAVDPAAIHWFDATSGGRLTPPA